MTTDRMRSYDSWRNWAGTETANPRRVVRPRDVQELAAAVSAAARDGLTVKAVGSGHSFTGVAVTDGVQIRLDGMDGVVDVDAKTGLVTVEAGIPLHRLNPLLESLGLCMTNLGDIDRQTISGAISTGTHGTGARYGGIATQVRGLQLVLANGELISCSDKENPDLFAAARIGLGALGVIANVTLQCETVFDLHAVEGPMALDRVLDELDDFVDDNDHFEFYWFPHTQRTFTKRNNRAPRGTPRKPVGAFGRWFDDELMSNSVFDLTNKLVRRFPRLVPGANNVAARAWSAREVVDVSYRVFTSPRRVVFREMEYAVPRSDIREVIRAVQSWIIKSGERISFPVEIRLAAPDDIWLSTAYDRETAYIAVHQYDQVPYERYFHAVEDICAGVGGRPHWGKLHWLDATELGARYPRFGDFARIRADVDPGGLFANPYLDRVLGPVSP
jgi:L-gulonolactone oxidase